MLGEILAPSRILPLIGLGVAFALVRARIFATALVLFCAGIGIGLAAEYWLLWALDWGPNPAMHLFRAGPIMDLAAGASLIAGTRWRAYAAPPAALICGAMLALTIRLTDPSLHELSFTVLPVLAALWIILAVTLTLRAFYRGWFAIVARILGSWLIAIGLLYGGASLVPPRKAPPAGNPPASGMPRP